MDEGKVGAEAPTRNEVRSGTGAAGDVSAADGAAGPSVADPTGAGPAAGTARFAGADRSAGAAPAAGSGSPGRSGEQSVRLVLWRHGQTQWNVDGRFQGQSDIPLDPVGEQQAERAARLLAALQPAAIFSSDLARATATAAPLARLTGLRVIPEKDLRERFGGRWEGL